MSKRPGADWEGIIPESQWANHHEATPHSTSPEAATSETSFYWDDAILDSFPSGECHKFTHHGPPDAKRQRRGSTSTLEAEPLRPNTPAPGIPRKFRVTKSLGPGDFAGRHKPTAFSSVTSREPSVSSSRSIPPLTWSFESRTRYSSGPYGDYPETLAPVSPYLYPLTGGRIFPDRHHGHLPAQVFAPICEEPNSGPQPREWAKPLGAPALNVQPPALEDEDSYIVEASDEEELAKLVDSVSANPTHIPPSSVIRSMDSGTSHDPVFDPNLPGSSPTRTHNNTAPVNPGLEEEDLLDSDVDWDEITELLPSRPHDPSLSVSPKEVVTRQLIKSEEVHAQPLTPQRKPFVRPPFPEPIRDKSPVTGLSRLSTVRTCFRIGQILNETKKCFDNHQDVVFELYARVNYSSREKLARVQHFQFLDLFKEHLPYPTGTLNGWKTGSLVDEQSLVFLGSGDGHKAKLCRCICKPVKEKKRDLGWTFSVLAIRQVDWEEIDMMKGMVCEV